MAMNIASGALPIVPLVLLKNNTANGDTSFTVDWTRYKVVIIQGKATGTGSMYLQIGGNDAGGVTTNSGCYVRSELLRDDLNTRVFSMLTADSPTGNAGAVTTPADSTVGFRLVAATTKFEYVAFGVAIR